MVRLTNKVVQQAARWCSQAAWTPTEQPRWRSRHDQVGGEPVGEVVAERNMLVLSLWRRHACRVDAFRDFAPSRPLAFPVTLRHHTLYTILHIVVGYLFNHRLARHNGFLQSINQLINTLIMRQVATMESKIKLQKIIKMFCIISCTWNLI